MRARMLILAALLAAGCRDAASVPDFGVREPHTDSGTVRLTYSIRDDRTPVWRGDSVYYMTSGQPTVSRAHEWIAAIHRLGPVTRALLPDQDLTSALPKRFGAPALSGDGTSIAIVEVTDTSDLTTCSMIMCDSVALTDRGTVPHIRRARLHVRRLANARITEATLDIPFDGHERLPDPDPRGVSPVYALRVHPFHVRYSGDRDPVFRPSFSPDGNRIAFSDGLNVYVWTVGGAVTVLPGSADGVFPAWSPDGQWIAFSKLDRREPINDFCTCLGSTGRPAEYYDRAVYASGRELTQLMLVRPDGTGLRELGEGYAPAWTPDGSGVVVSRSDGFLWEVPLSGTPRRIDATESGREPALSADGRLLAFARLVQPRNADIWIVPFTR